MRESILLWQCGGRGEAKLVHQAHDVAVHLHRGPAGNRCAIIAGDVLAVAVELHLVARDDVDVREFVHGGLRHGDLLAAVQRVLHARLRVSHHDFTGGQRLHGQRRGVHVRHPPADVVAFACLIDLVRQGLGVGISAAGGGHIDGCIPRGEDGHVDGAWCGRAADVVGVGAVVDAEYQAGDAAGDVGARDVVLQRDGEDGELVLQRGAGQVVAVPIKIIMSSSKVEIAGEFCQRAVLLRTEGFVVLVAVGVGHRCGVDVVHARALVGLLRQIEGERGRLLVRVRVARDHDVVVRERFARHHHRPFAHTPVNQRHRLARLEGLHAVRGQRAGRGARSARLGASVGSAAAEAHGRRQRYHSVLVLRLLRRVGQFVAAGAGGHDGGGQHGGRHRDESCCCCH